MSGASISSWLARPLKLRLMLIRTSLAFAKFRPAALEPCIRTPIHGIQQRSSDALSPKDISAHLPQGPNKIQIKDGQGYGLRRFELGPVTRDVMPYAVGAGLLPSSPRAMTRRTMRATP